MSNKNESDLEEEDVRIQWTDSAIREQMSSYGAMYFPAEVKETIDDIIGCEVQKERLDDFFKALKKYEEFKDQLKKANLAPNLTVLLLLLMPLTSWMRGMLPSGWGGCPGVFLSM